MNQEQLLQYFDQIADAPDAVECLRRFVLDLAIRGKLIRPERIWIRESLVGDFIQFQNGYAFQSSWFTKEGVRLCRNTNVAHGTLNWIETARVPQTMANEFEKFALREGDIVLSLDRPIISTGLKVARVSKSDLPCLLLQRVARAIPLTDQISLDFLHIWLQSSAFLKMIDPGRSNGVPHISTKQVESLSLELPSLAEQQRIVAKVDELMTLCDELEAARAQRETRRDQLVASTLHSLANGDTYTDHAPGVTNGFAEHARFYFNHLPRLTTRPAHIKQLRQTILNLAVCGKLVTRDPNDEPITTLLRKIDEERTLIARKDRRADSEIQELLADELCWEVPPAWRWRGIADLALFIDYRGQTPSKVDSGIRLITAKNVRPGFIKLDPEEFVTESTYQVWMTRGLPGKGDVLFTTEAPMGNAAVIELEEKFALAQRTICFHLFGGLNPRFVTLQLLSPLFQAILDSAATGLTAKGIKAAKLKRLPFAVPPLAEQHRIVAKVDELMALCDKLEAQLTTAASTRRQLLEATLHEALNEDN